MASNCHHFTSVILVITVIVCFTVIKAAPPSSLVTKLPGFNGSFPSKHYSGYVKIGEHKAKHMYYYFVESEKNPTKDPVVLWLNGGPGCSSLGAFVYEHGPFNFEASGPINSRDLPKLHLNPNSWSKVSNIIYLDSPVGTGFSFSRNSSDYITGDLKTASDLYTFLLKWFKKFPEHLSNPFFIAGESYAGVFIPTLAYKLMKGLHSHSSSRPVINLKGYMIGNGVTDKYFDGNAAVPFAHGMGLISDDLYQEITDVCHGSYLTPSSEKCQSKLDKFQDVVQNVNTYNILEQCYAFYYEEGYQCYRCIGEGDLMKYDMNMSRRFGKLRRKEKLLAPYRRTFSDSGGINILCHNDMGPDLWLNNDAVRKAIHAAKKHKIGRWEYCTNSITYHDDAGSMIKYHKRLISKGLRVLIYSGDHDMVVPYTGSEAWTRSLGYKIIDEWRPWIYNSQVAGYTQGYDRNFTFLSVKGAGHIVPEDKPSEALAFYSRWLAGEKI